MGRCYISKLACFGNEYGHAYKACLFYAILGNNSIPKMAKSCHPVLTELGYFYLKQALSHR